MALFSSLIAINPEVEKFNYVNINSNEQNNLAGQNEIIDLKEMYLLYKNNQEEKTNIFKERILSFVNSKFSDNTSISLEVLNCSYKFLDNIYPRFLEVIDIDNIYPTSYGTLIFDWEKDVDNIFSLEIGATKIGYFIEVDGKDIKQEDGFQWKDGRKMLLDDLTNFLFD